METIDKSHVINLKSIKIANGLKIISIYIDNAIYKF